MVYLSTWDAWKSRAFLPKKVDPDPYSCRLRKKFETPCLQNVLSLELHHEKSIHDEVRAESNKLSARVRTESAVKTALVEAANARKRAVEEELVLVKEVVQAAERAAQQAGTQCRELCRAVMSVSEVRLMHCFPMRHKMFSVHGKKKRSCRSGAMQMPWHSVSSDQLSSSRDCQRLARLGLRGTQYLYGMLNSIAL
jgi:hypothetical protein